MPLTRAAVLTLTAALTLAAAPPAAAYVEDRDPPNITFGAWRYTVGTTLSDATAAARIPVTINWSQWDESGICEALWYVEDSQGGHDENSEYPGDERHGSAATTMPAQGSATILLQTIDCSGHDHISRDQDSRDSTLVQQTAVRRWGGWRGVRLREASGGSLIASTAAGAAASYRFHGSSVALIGATGRTVAVHGCMSTACRSGRRARAAPRRGTGSCCSRRSG